MWTTALYLCLFAAMQSTVLCDCSAECAKTDGCCCPPWVSCSCGYCASSLALDEVDAVNSCEFSKHYNTLSAASKEAYWTKAYCPDKTVASSELVDVAHEMADTNRDGTVSCHELNEFMTRVPHEMTSLCVNDGNV